MSNILVLRSFVSKVQLSVADRRRIQHRSTDTQTRPTHHPLPKGETLADSFLDLAFSV